MTPQDFITKWGPGGPAFDLNEEQGAQSHFIDLCDLLGVPKPGSEDGYLFEKQTLVLGDTRGYADVFKRGAFAWENKAPGKNLDSALKQLLNYSSALSNPPILVVCDRLQIRVQTQFTGHPTEKFTVLLAELAQPDKLAQLRRIWLDPESFRPKITSRDITEKAAKSFATLADSLRKRGPQLAQDPAGFQAHADDVAHFLTQCLFCFFAEDVGLLPGRMFDGLVNNRQRTPDKLTEGMSNLFNVMRDGGMYGNDDIPWFNGGLFKTVKVPPLTILDVTELRNAAALNWSAIDVSIFGTLFERGLDPAKRSQLGAHYTDPATIMRIIEPVLQRPLLQIWELLAQDLIGLMAKSKRKYDANYKLAQAKFVDWLDQLKNYRVLDPACGSGNFLFLGLKALKDIEHQSHLAAAAMGLDREADLVTGPHNMLGIELNEYAAELARVTVWIGELQWRLAHGYEFKKNPVLEPLDNIECRDALLSFLPLPLGEGRGEGSPLPNAATQNEARAGQTPAAHTLRFLKSPQMSAPPAPLASVSGGSKLGSDPSSLPTSVRAEPVEASWPRASIVIGNPPFLGAKKHFSELGVDYTKALRKVYESRVPGLGDLVTYWFEKVRGSIRTQGLAYAGLVATNSIRDGASQRVLDALYGDATFTDIHPDCEWVNDGAAVRVALVCVSAKNPNALQRVDGQVVPMIYADLGYGSAKLGTDFTKAVSLEESGFCAFTGSSKKGKFEVEGRSFREWLKQPNPNGLSNANVLRKFSNGRDITGRDRDYWVVDFGPNMEMQDAALYVEPFEHVRRFVKPARDMVRNPAEKRLWWLHARSLRDLRSEIDRIPKFIVTTLTAKHRLFSWRASHYLPDNSVVVITRSDDTTFGILHSRFHELWSLRMGTSLEDRPRYTPTTCFETFPFPQGLTPADTAHQITEAIAGGALIPAGISTSSMRTGGGSIRAAAEKIATAAKRLNDLREAWLNPPDWTDRVPEVTPLGMASSPYPDRILPKPGHEKDLADRTLTKLYNARPAWLDAAHKALDEAVTAAYGWTDYTADMPDEEILKRLLALNLERAEAQKSNGVTP